MDISVFRAVAAELSDALAGARLSDMEEDGLGGIVLTFRVPTGGRRGVYIYSRPDLPRIHLLETMPRTVKGLTPSVRAIRNEVAGFTVESVGYEGFERTVAFRLARKRGGELLHIGLVYELAGKKPNLIAIDGEGRVAAALSYASLTDEGPRPLLVGLTYDPPPRPDKLDPAEATAEEVARILASDPEATPEKALFKGIWGLSPLLAREAVAMAGGGDAEAVTRVLKSVMSKVLDGPYSPRIYDTPKGPVLAAFGLTHLGDALFTRYGTMSEAAAAFYTRLDEEKRFRSLRSSMLHEIKKSLKAVERRIGALKSDLETADMAEEYTHYGNLLMAALKDVPHSTENVTLPDIFDEARPEIVIPLDPSMDAVRNAERYFRMSRKARTGAGIVKGRLADAQAERDLLVSRLEELEGARILDELEELSGKSGRRPGVDAAGGRMRTVELPHFVSSDGFEVFYGKNAKQNDTVTFRFAGPMDLWLHAQGYHGAHVVVRNPERRPDIPLATILEAASVAAYFSRAKKDKSVAVDYTFKKYVRKPRDPVPGQVIFTQNKTVFVDPAPPGRKG